jgi:hypothetical protein
VKSTKQPKILVKLASLIGRFSQTKETSLPNGMPEFINSSSDPIFNIMRCPFSKYLYLKLNIFT